MRHDLKGFSSLASFMCEHPRVCGRPRYVRGVLCWLPGMGAAMDADNVRGAILRGLHWITPGFIGVRVVQCLSCGTVAFNNRFARAIMKFTRFVLDPGMTWMENILLIAEDVDSFGDDTMERYNLDPTKHH